VEEEGGGGSEEGIDAGCCCYGEDEAGDRCLAAGSVVDEWEMCWCRGKE
jgi:hypothetical protein